MRTIRRGRMLKLLILLVPLLAGVGYLARLLLDEPWKQQGMVSPTAMLSLKVILVCVVLLVPVAVLLYRCDRRPHARLRSLHSDEGGTAMVEMLIALPFMTIILLVLLQAVLMWQGSMTVHYAGYAATRGAITIINGRYGDEGRHLMFNDLDPRTPPSLKGVRIHRLAKMALLPVCGQWPQGYDDDPEMMGDDFRAVVTQALTNGPNSSSGMANEPWVRRLAGQYAYAEQCVHLAIRPPHHWNFPEPERGNRCPMRATRRTDWTQWGYNHENFCPHITHTFDYPFNEPIQIVLIFQLPLEVPWANRILYLVMPEGETENSIDRMTTPTGESLYFTPITVATEL